MSSPVKFLSPSGGGRGGGFFAALGIAVLFLAAQVPAFADWPTYHKDGARTGYDSTAPALSNSVNQQWARTGLDADVYAEPLVYGTMVLVATEANTIYALDAATGNVLWSKNYGISVPNAQLPCGNIDPVGITGTPVIDSAAGRMYFIGLMWDGTTPSTIHYQLEAINLNATGTELWNRTIAPTDPTYTFDVLAQGQRSALSLASGNVYIPFGGRAGDCGNYRGWMVGAPVSGTGTLLSFPLPTGLSSGAGGFWATSGNALDASNNLYVTSGNTRSTTTFDYGESVLKLSPTLTLTDYFAPANWSALNASDTDLGSVGPTLLGNNLLFQVGKEGVGYLLDITNLGGVNHDTPRFSAQVCNATFDAAFGGVAYSAPYLYVPCSDHLEALTVNTGATPSFTKVWSGPAGSIGPPIVAGGLVWTMGWNNSRLFGLFATTGEVRLSVALPLAPMHFSTPASGDGLVFVPDGSEILAYGSACGAASTRQYSLPSSDGVTWTSMDTANLQQTLAPSASQWALLEANADLWTARAGFNQDIGIFVSTNGGADTLVGWKESGGNGGTFSPNAAFLQVPFAVVSGSTYVVKLKWKTNRDARPTGATIYAGAGGAGPYSHTSLSARLIPTASLQTSAIFTQPVLAGNDGATWAPLGTGGTPVTVTLTPTAASTAILGANADLWTASAGYNQDLGIFVSVNNGADSLVAWKESGGFAGTFSPNAAFVHTVYAMAAGSTYAFKLKWKTNRPDAGGIYSGAGSGSPYSQTRLTAETLPAGVNPRSTPIATQQTLISSDGATWAPVSAALDQTIAPTAQSVVMLSGNADMFTATAGYNQDLGIFVSIGGAPDELVAWKESGGYNGTFSPNAAYVQSPFVMSAGTSYRFSLKWKTNRNAPGVTIYMGAGAGPPYSPTRLTADIVSC